MPQSGASADRKRFAETAQFASELATAVGNAIAITDIAIITRKRGRANFATAADHAAEKTIIKALRARDSTVAILAEESSKGKIAKADRLWVVDPIDGTLNFSRGLPFYCVAIGYVEDGRVRAAAVYAPRTGETFVASEGHGATLNGRRIAVSATRRPGEAFAVSSLGFKSTTKPGSRFVALNSTCARLRVIGSAVLEQCYVACGRVDLFVHEFLSPWDVAASQLIAREAGSAVLSLKTGEDAAWNESRIIMGNPALVKSSLKAMPELLGSKE